MVHATPSDVTTISQPDARKKTIAYYIGPTRGQPTLMVVRDPAVAIPGSISSGIP
jgi:hypothetical protein